MGSPAICLTSFIYVVLGRKGTSQWYDMFMRSAKNDQELLKLPAEACSSQGDEIRNDLARMRGPDFQVLPETLLNRLEYKYGQGPTIDANMRKAFKAVFLVFIMIVMVQHMVYNWT
jgi:hypothetical protein